MRFRDPLFFVFLLTLLLLTAPVGAATTETPALVADGELLVADDDRSLSPIHLPFETHRAFGHAAGKPLVTVEHKEPTVQADVLDAVIDLWLADADDPRRLTDGELVLGAVWSEALDDVFYWTAAREVHRVAIDGTSHELVAARAITPALSPDGLELAYVQTPRGWAFDAHVHSMEIRIRDLSTGEERSVLSGTDAHDLVWSPDGSTLLFQASSEGLTSWWRVDAAGGPAVQITNRGLWTAKSPFFVKNPSRNTDVRWSPDGRRLTYGASYAEAGEIMVLEFDDGYDVVRAYQLTTGTAPSWADSTTVLVPRHDPLRGAAAVRFEEFPVDSYLASATIDVAGLSADAITASQPVRLKAAPPVPFKAVDRYRWPIHSSAGHPYTAYYDNNGGSGQLDWRCGTFTYNNHRGTDVGVNGWWIYAGANGSLWASNDGCPTTGYIGSGCGGGFGNYVKLSHGWAQSRNWYTIYAHLRNGSVVASYHSCGNRLGISGSSGNSSGPHLHFEVNAYGHPGDDPFSGSCSGSVSYWCNQNGGYPTTGCC
ncbi:MAG: peptidoglycan DD-metalloendopeptidase family protein [Acidobacteriota bacterium]